MKKILLLLTAFISMAASAAVVGDRYTKVNSTDDIVVGEEYILCYETNAMGAQDGKFRVRVADGVTIDGDVATINDAAVSEFKLVNGTVADSFSFMFSTGYWACASAANNNNSEVSEQNDVCDFTITVNEGVAIIVPIVASSTSASCKMQYNSASGSERFSNYKTGSQKNCTLYKKDNGTVDPIPVTVDMPVITFDEPTSTVSITCETEGAAIYYTLDGTTPDETSTLYTEPFTVAESCTVQAVAVKEDVSSDIASQEIFVFAKGDNVTVTFDLLTNSYDIPDQVAGSGSNDSYIPAGTSCKNENVTLTFDKTSGNGFRFWSDGLRVYNGNVSMKFEVDGTITGIAIKMKSGATFSSVMVDNETLSISDNTYTWTGENDKEATVLISTSSTKAIESITVTYTEGVVNPITIEKPVITFDEATSTVSMTCETEGAAIYYTLDGTTPDETSTLYTEPFTVAESCTVQAVAFKDGDHSEATSQDIVIAVVGGTPVETIFDFKTSTYGIEGQTAGSSSNATYFKTATCKNEDVTLSFDSTVTNGFRFWTDGLRIYKTGSGEANLKIEVNGTITDIVITYANAFTSVKLDGADFVNDTNAKTYTWTGSIENEANVVITQTGGNNAMSGLSVTYIPAAVDPDAVAKPVITYDEVTATVSMTCDTEEAAIHYTLDGTTPDENSTLYTEPFTVAESCTVQAVAIKNGNSSPVASKDVTVLESAKSIAELLAMAPAKDDKAIVGCELTVVYVNGLNVYVTDAFGGSTLLYGNNSYNAGDVIPAGWEATCSPFNGLIEYKGTFPAATGTAEFTIPEVASVSIEDMNRVVTVTNVTFTEATPADKANFDGILEDGSTLTFRNNFTIASTDKGIYNVKIAVAAYNGNIQVYPIEYTLMGVLMDKVETPVFSPAGGTITEATDVTITCDTEDAVIYYTLDGTTPDENSAVYEGPITIAESTIIKAVAYANYMLPSEVATAEFIYDDGTGPKYEMATATFIFNDSEGITELGLAIPEPGAETSIDELPIVNGPITILATKGTNNTNPRIWNSTSDVLDLRLYKGNTFTVSAEGNTDIREIIFSGYTVNTILYFNNAVGTSAKKVTWTASDAAVINNNLEFTFSGTTRIDTMTVTYMTTTGVANVAADDENAPVEYYNLQGVRVEEPAAGLYIRRQGNNVTKVVIR